MIGGWENREDWWTSIGSLDVVQKPQSKGCLGIRMPVSLSWSGVKKNNFELLRSSAPEFLRQKGSADTGYALWWEADLSGGGDTPGAVSGVWEGEAGDVDMVGEESFIHKAVRLFRGAALSLDGDPRCSRGSAFGLAYGEGIGEAVYEGTAGTCGSPRSPVHRDRRDIDTERAYVPHSGERFEAATSDLVRWNGSIGGKSKSILRVAGAGEERQNTIGGGGYVEGLRELDAGEGTSGRYTLRQIPRDAAFGEGLGYDQEEGILPAFWEGPIVHQGPEVHAALSESQPQFGWQEVAEETAECQQKTSDCLSVEGNLRPTMGLSHGGLGEEILRELEERSQMAAPRTVPRVCWSHRASLERHCGLLQARRQSVVRFCRRSQQQDTRHTTKGVWVERRRVPSTEGINLYVGNDMNQGSYD